MSNELFVVSSPNRNESEKLLIEKISLSRSSKEILALSEAKLKQVLCSLTFFSRF